MFTRCVECELVVMPRPIMVCDDCAKVNERMIRRMQWISTGYASPKSKTQPKEKK